MIRIDMAIGLNDKVRVKLTDYGYKVYCLECTLNKTPSLPYTSGIFYFTIGEIMMIFGKYIGSSTSKEQIFKDDKVVLELR